MYMGLGMLCRQKYTAEPLVPEPGALEVGLAIENLKSHKSPGIDQKPAEMIKEGGSTIRCAIHKVIIAIWNKEELPGEWKVSIVVPIHNIGTTVYDLLQSRHLAISLSVTIYTQ